jgi:hypothetical protein
MAFVVSCPCCVRKLLLPKGAGGLLVCCPLCLTTFTAPKATSEGSGIAPDEVAASCAEPQKEPGQTGSAPLDPSPGTLCEDRHPWEQLRSGLGWILAGTCIQVVLLVVQFLGHLYWDDLLDFHGLDVLRLAWFALGLVSLLGGGCTVFGLIVCISSPHQGMRRWLGVTALCLTLVFLLPVAYQSFTAGGSFSIDGSWWHLDGVGIFALVTSPGGHLALGFVVLFIREGGRALRDRRTLSRFRWMVPLYIGVPLFTFAAWLALTGGDRLAFHVQFPSEFQDRFFLLGLFHLPVVLLLFQQIRLTRAARRAVERYLYPFGRSPIEPEEDIPCTTMARMFP